MGVRLIRGQLKVLGNKALNLTCLSECFTRDEGCEAGRGNGMKTFVLSDPALLRPQPCLGLYPTHWLVPPHC
jgi:hypothetical protein